MATTASVTRRLPHTDGPGWRVRIHVLWERKWILLTTIVVLMTCTLFWLSKQIPIYRATARILIEADTVKILNIQEFANSDFRDWDTLGSINTQIRILQSRPLAQMVVKSLRLDQNPDFLPGSDTNTDFAVVVQGGVTATSQREDRKSVV